LAECIACRFSVDDRCLSRFGEALDVKLLFLRGKAAESTTNGVSDGAERAVSSDPAPIRVAVGDGGDVDALARACVKRGVGLSR